MSYHNLPDNFAARVNALKERALALPTRQPAGITPFLTNTSSRQLCCNGLHRDQECPMPWVYFWLNKKRTRPYNAAPAGMLTPNIQFVAEVLKVYKLGDHSQGLYVEWDIPWQSAVAVLRALGLQGEHSTRLGLDIPKLRHQQSRVFVEAKAGGPLGYYLHEISTRKDRVTALIPQTWGFTHQNPCANCEERFRRSYTAYVNDQGAWEYANVLWPFFGCKSLPGFRDGRCGNCCYHLESCSLENNQRQGLSQWKEEWTGKRGVSAEYTTLVGNRLTKVSVEGATRVEDVSFKAEDLPAMISVQMKEYNSGLLVRRNPNI